MIEPRINYGRRGLPQEEIDKLTALYREVGSHYKVAELTGRTSQYRLGFTSLDAPLNSAEGTDTTYGEVFCGEEESTTDSLDFGDRTEVLKELLARLDPRERGILQGRFFDNRTLEEVASDYGLTRERIRQIEAKALRRIRSMPQLAKLKEAA